MVPVEWVTKLFKEVQENTLAALWSQGVSLTRESTTFLVLSQSPDECVISLRIAGQLVSPKVILWPKNLEWDCDCGSIETPCSHIAAAVIMLKRGGLKTVAEINTNTAEQPTHKNLAEIHYAFLRTPQGLAFERYLVWPGSKKTFKMPILSYLTGQKSGRLNGPEIIPINADHNIDQILRTYTGGPLDRPKLEALFNQFEPDQKIFLDEKPISLSNNRVVSNFECLDEANGYRLRRSPISELTEAFPHGVFLFGDTLKLGTPVFLTHEERAYFANEGTYWGPEKEKELCTKIIPELQKKISLKVYSLKLPQALELSPRVEILLEKDKDERGQYFLSALANIVYGNPAVAQLNYETLKLGPIRSRPSNLYQQILRSQSGEHELIQRLGRELSLQPGRRVSFYGTEALDFVKKIKNWDLLGDGYEAFSPDQKVLVPKIDLSEGATVSFGVRFVPQSGDSNTQHSVDFEKAFNFWQQGSDSVPLIDGSWAKLPRDWMSKFGKRVEEFLASREANSQVPTYKVPELAALCEDLGQGFSESLKSLKTKLHNFECIPEYPLPLDLRATLRPYQMKGVNWLCFLRNSGLGALLADDMGLGKTLQMICAIKGKTLIVAPTSVLFNWKDELNKFRPGLKVGFYYGAKREFDHSLDVILTSYGVLRLDQEKFLSQNWDTIVLDEAQNIKNPDSQVSRAALSLKGNFRVTLSGTPIENRLDDLWSQFHFINPGLLGNKADFLNHFARPIERGQTEVASKLKYRVKPFILRRLKKEVASELPPRTESVLRCELNEAERQTYEAILAATKNEVLASLDHGGSILKALEVILRLRQACCHMALIPGQTAETSSKLNLLMETLEESLAEGHKSLIFSQWTSFLDLIEKEFERKGLRSSRIDGSTSNRGDIVKEFQSTDGPPLMLISLKAGGVGLTLTAADHVFIMDPWWNPSVEDQAADRAHRIGQQNPVLIHRLVAMNSIEEKILLLQEKKKDLARSVLDEGGAALGLSRQDILDLLS